MLTLFVKKELFSIENPGPLIYSEQQKNILLSQKSKGSIRRFFF